MHGNGLPPAVRTCVFVQDGVFVVVVPACINAVIQNLGLELRLPPRNCLGVGEIQVRTLTIPIGFDHRFLLRILDEGFAGDVFIKRRMVIQQAGFDVGHQMHAVVVKFLVQRFGIRKFVVIPSEHITSLAPRRVTRSVMKGRYWHAVVLGQVNELRQLMLCIWRVGQAHGRLRITQSPARRQVRAAYELHELGDHFGRCVTHHQVVIQVAIVNVNVAIKVVVVVVLATEIKRAAGQCVVVNANPLPLRRATQNKRPMLVERIAMLGVIAQRVHRQRAQATTAEIERACFVAQAVKLFGIVALDVMAHSARAFVAQVSAGAAIAEHHLFTSLVLPMPHQAQGVGVQLNAQL